MKWKVGTVRHVEFDPRKLIFTIQRPRGPIFTTGAVIQYLNFIIGEAENYTNFVELFSCCIKCLVLWLVGSRKGLQGKELSTCSVWRPHLDHVDLFWNCNCGRIQDFSNCWAKPSCLRLPDSQRFLNTRRKFQNIRRTFSPTPQWCCCLPVSQSLKGKSVADKL